LEACWPYLKRQLDAIQPKIIVCLGKHALARFLPGKSISEVRGRAFRVGHVVYFPMYHPAAALYQGSLKQTLFQDMAKLPALLKQIKQGTGTIEELGSNPGAAALAPPEETAQGKLL
jgi:DNA polymerase